MKKHWWILFCIIPCLLLTGCDSKSRYDDLRQQMEAYQDKVRAESKKINTADIPPIKPVSYKPLASRSPFKAIPLTESAKVSGQLLTSYPANTLRYVGMIKHPEGVTAVLETPNQKLYEAMKGDRVGDHHGKITDISIDQLEISEPISQDDPSLGMRKIILKLKDAKS